MSHISAKRAAPTAVEPVHSGDVRYEVAGMGIVRAWDEKNNRELWNSTVYAVEYIPNLEKDVQDVWITSLAIEDGVLNVLDEKGRSYRVDAETGGVPKGDAGSIDIFMIVLAGIGAFSAFAFLVYKFMYIR